MSKELTLRAYEPRDIPRLIELVFDSVPQMPNYSMIKVDKYKTEYMLKHGVSNGSAFAGWALCDSHDMIQGFGAAWCVESVVSLDMIADDLFFWINAEYRTYRNASKLYNVLIEWAKAKGAKLIRASHTGGMFPPGTREHKLYDAMLRRHGFRMVGNVYHHGEV